MRGKRRSKEQRKGARGREVEDTRRSKEDTLKSCDHRTGPQSSGLLSTARRGSGRRCCVASDLRCPAHHTHTTTALTPPFAKTLDEHPSRAEAALEMLLVKPRRECVSSIKLVVVGSTLRLCWLHAVHSPGSAALGRRCFGRGDRGC